MKISKILLNISAFVCYLFGAFYIFSLVFIPIGVYCMISAKKFSFKAEHLFDTYAISNKQLKAYVIFASIFCFPLGLISIIPYYMIVSNKIKIADLKIMSLENESANSDEIVEENAKEESEKAETEQKIEVQEETEEEKLEKLKKLENFKEKGIITEDEFNMAKEQLNLKK